MHETLQGFLQLLVHFPLLVKLASLVLNDLLVLLQLLLDHAQVNHLLILCLLLARTQLALLRVLLFLDR